MNRVVQPKSALAFVEVIHLKCRLIIALNLGVSLTKGAYKYSIDEGIHHEGVKTSCPAVRQLTYSKYKSVLNQADNNSSLVAFADSYWLVGEVARGQTLSFSATQSKRKTAITKSLAFIGQVVSELNAQGVDEVYLTFGLLLPLDFFGSRQELEQQLQSALWEPESNGVTVNTVLSEKVQISQTRYGIAQTVANLPRLKAALTIAREQIRSELTEKLVDYSLAEVEKVLGSGGNAYYWKNDVSCWLGARLDKGRALLTEMSQRFPYLTGSPLLYRCADNYKFWQTLPKVTKFLVQEYAHV